jgi:hypothetical protein
VKVGLSDSILPLALIRVALSTTRTIETVLSTRKAFLISDTGVGWNRLGLAIRHAFFFIEEEIQRLIAGCALGS